MTRYLKHPAQWLHSSAPALLLMVFALAAVPQMAGADASGTAAALAATPVAELSLDAVSSGKTVAQPDKNTIVVVNRPAITGLWALSFPQARCVEYYNFMEDGEVAIKSGEEWTYGNYVYQVPAASEAGLPVLAMRIKYDNLQTDCSGNAIDQRGEEQQHYVKWHSASTVDFCAAEGQPCFANLRRILP